MDKTPDKNYNLAIEILAELIRIATIRSSHNVQAVINTLVQGSWCYD